MKSIIYFLSMIFLVITTACSFVSSDREHIPSGFGFDRNLKEVKVYLIKSKGKDISFIPVKRKISKDISIVDGALRELFLGPTKTEELKGIKTEIPVGTRLIKVEESEDEILVDVSSQYLTGGGSATMQLRYLQLYKTLKKINPYKKFYLHIDGKSIKAIGGEGLEVSQPLTKINDYTQINEKTRNVHP